MAESEKKKKPFAGVMVKCDTERVRTLEKEWNI